ncbi:MAG TPA: hypothetical protein VGD81_19070 [Opitutaceae bacterium]
MYPHERDTSEPHFTAPGVPVRHSAAAAAAILEAIARAERALHAGQLLTPFEAMALAGPEARSKQTLFSIARDVAWATHTDQDELLAALGERFPEFK